jgi:hypothetical protein
MTVETRVTLAAAAGRPQGAANGKEEAMHLELKYCSM